MTKLFFLYKTKIIVISEFLISGVHRSHPLASPVKVFGMVDVSHIPILGYMQVMACRDAIRLLLIR